MRAQLLRYLAPALVIGTLQAQPPVETAPTIRMSTRIVLVPIVATRSNGSQISDLSPSDLQVSDNGQVQTILSLERTDGISSPTRTGARGPRTAASSAPDPSPHFVIILLDALNTSWSDQIYAREAVEHLLDYSPPGERIALFALSNKLYLLHDFSSSAAELRAALHGLASDAPGQTSAPSAESRYSAALSYSDLVALAGTMRDRTGASESEARLFQRIRIGQTFEALKAIAQVVKNLPGQKDLLWVSSAFPLLVRSKRDPMDNDSYLNGVKESARTLSSAGLRAYPIDARGLLVGRNAPINIGTMEELADDTGGKAFYNSNDLTSLMRSALEDSRTGYLLTYSPRDLREDGAFHTIRVRALRSRVKLRYRPGYYAEELKRDDR